MFVLPFALRGPVAEPLCMAAGRHPPVPKTQTCAGPQSQGWVGSSFPSWLLIHRPEETVMESHVVLPSSQRSHPLLSLLAFLDVPGTMVVMGRLWGGIELQGGFLFAEPQRDLG